MEQQQKKTMTAREFKVQKVAMLSELASQFLQADADGELKKVTRPAKGKIVLSR